VFAATTDGIIHSGGVERQYKLFAPAARGWPLPLVLNIHGFASGKDLFAEMNQMGALAQGQRFVAVFGHALGNPPSWVASAQGNDVNYLNDLVDTVESRLCIDIAREYVTGFSQGAVMTTLLACADSERFAAAAPVAGIAEVNGCEPTHKMPVVAFHGTDDPLVLYQGGLVGPDGKRAQPPEGVSAERPVTKRVATWAEYNNCEGRATESRPADHARLLHYDCHPRADVELYVLDGAGHTWPGSEPNALASILGSTNMSVDATEIIWDFFQHHARG
jgi:polyhydroxybutyrate depolymerase